MEENKMSKQIQHKEVVPYLGKEQLHEYQNRAVKHILNIPKSALFLDMGL
jgi:hypothetical protein